MILEKTVLYLIHNCLKFVNCSDSRLKWVCRPYPIAVIASSPFPPCTPSSMTGSRWSTATFATKATTATVAMSISSPLDQLPVVIRVLEYMVRFLILFTHYCFGETDFLSSRNTSLDKWFAELMDFYKRAVETRASVSPPPPVESYDCLSNCGEILSYYVLHKNNQRTVREKCVPSLLFLQRRLSSPTR